MFYMLHRFFLKVWLRGQRGSGIQGSHENKIDHSRIGTQGEKYMRMARTRTGNAVGSNGGDRQEGSER